MDITIPKKEGSKGPREEGRGKRRRRRETVRQTTRKKEKAVVVAVHKVTHLIPLSSGSPGVRVNATGEPV